MSSARIPHVHFLIALLTPAALCSSELEAQTRLRTSVPLAFPGPATVTATAIPNGVRIDWQLVQGAQQYWVMRGPPGTTPGLQVGGGSSVVSSFVDANTAAAEYLVIATAPDGRRGASAAVSFVPPALPTATLVVTGSTAGLPTRTRPTSTATASTPPPDNTTPAVTRRITGATPVMFRSGATVRVTGVGFAGVAGAYFGTGAPGSSTNLRMGAVRVSEGEIDVATSRACKQSGPLTLEIAEPGGSSIYVTPDTAITLHCFPAIPSGTISGMDNTGYFRVGPTGSVTVTGSNLRAVTNAVDQLQRKYPVAFTTNGVTDALTFPLGPSFSPGDTLRFTLEHVLGGSASGTVMGAVFMLRPPTVTRLAPAWGEPGQRVRIDGEELNSGGTPQVMFGTTPGTLLSVSPTVVEVRVPSLSMHHTTQNPGQQLQISIVNPGGSAPLSQPFTLADGSTHPGFFLVGSGSQVTQLVAAAPPVAFGDTLTVTGHNLARLGGVCVVYRQAGTTTTAVAILPRVDQQIGYATSNTTMRVVLQDQPSLLQNGWVTPYQPSQPPGDHPPSQFACSQHRGSLYWLY